MPWSMARPYPAVPVPKAGAHLKQPDTIASLDTMYVSAFVKFFQRASAAAARSNVGASTAGNNQSLHRRKPTSSGNCDEERPLRCAFCAPTFRVQQKAAPMENSTARHYIA